ncbi:DNA gyrase inhibitor YacG [Candidatus Binatus sp.]|uniref:DNA gyrase inhibitor YacG n=1 Tax=Candidatus Binatus sp. TaxID=2811406 RepID=UPI003CC527AC
MKCPICKKPADLSPRNRFRPFCSERCQMIDLGTWVSGDYEKQDSQPAGHEHHDDLKKRRLLN